MEIQAFENLILAAIKNVVENVIKETPTLPIVVKQGERQGDAISKFLENAFVTHTKAHEFLKDSKASPLGKTKNPYDVATFFVYNEHREMVWIDFKAVNIANEDSNPDSGTPDKVITLIQNGSFYLAYIFVFYEGRANDLAFVAQEGSFVKAYFLKDISATVRITPANQLQVNYAQPPIYRTREEFINFLVAKKKESFLRRFKQAEAALLAIERGVILKDITVEGLITENQKQEASIKNL
jgi:hypothetical protein